MTRTGNSLRSGRAEVWLLAGLLSAAASGIAAADDQSPQPVAPAAAPLAAAPAPSPSTSFPPTPPPIAYPGFLNQFGGWWNGSFGDVDSKTKSTWDRLDLFNRPRDPAGNDATVATPQVLKDAAQATKDAATAVVRLPATRVFELRDRCRTAANGAPDCQSAALNACRGKGFSNGHPLDVSTLQDCPARVMLSGQPPADGECTDKTFILRVICQ
jgi:hypothetical protein